MSRSHKIWVEAYGGTSKPFGCGQDDSIRMGICVGTSATHSRLLSNIRIAHYEYEDEIRFDLIIDGQVYRSEVFNRKTKEFRGVEGRRITGNPKIQEIREKKAAESFMNTVGMVAAMGNILAGDSQKEKNDWKERMIRAGLGNKGLIMPEDWGKLSEDEKEKRLNNVIETLNQ